jgi:hypothetical protein
LTTEVMVPAESPSFLVSSLDLKPVLKRLSAQSKAAIDVLVKLLESKDERTRMSAATKLLDFQVQIAKEINADQMQRLIAQVKLGSDAGGKSPLLVPEDKRPLVDFTTIREIS